MTRKRHPLKKRKGAARTQSARRRIPSSKKRFPIHDLSRLQTLPQAIPTPSLNPEVPSQPRQELPFSYNETKLVLLVRDHHGAYSYWDFSADTWHWIEDLRRREPELKCVLRIYNLDNAIHFDVPVQLEAQNWYLDLFPDTTFEAELGLLDSRGKFYAIVRSNRIHTPRNGPSPHVDPKWSYSRAEFEELYKLSGVNKTGHGSEIFSQFRRR